MRTVLVISREAAFGTALSSVLDPAKFQILVKEAIGDAEFLLVRGAIDVTLLDLELTDARAIRAIEELKSLAPSCPLFVYTSGNQWDWEEDAYLLGVQNVLIKPVRGKLLNMLLQRLFREALDLEPAPIPSPEAADSLPRGEGGSSHGSRTAVSQKPAGLGVVKFCVQGSRPTSTAARYTPAKLVAALENGLPIQELEDLQGSLDVPSEKLAPMLGISKATFHRRKGDAGKLSPAVSDRVVRYARLLGQAFEVFEDLEAAKRWLNAPQVGLGGAVPLDFARTEVGAREVENLLGRIEYGVYS